MARLSISLKSKFENIIWHLLTGLAAQMPIYSPKKMLDRVLHPFLLRDQIHIHSVVDHQLRLRRFSPGASQIQAGGASERTHAVATPTFDDGRSAIGHYKLGLSDRFGDQENGTGIRLQLEEAIVGDLPITAASVFKKTFHHYLNAPNRPSVKADWCFLLKITCASILFRLPPSQIPTHVVREMETSPPLNP